MRHRQRPTMAERTDFDTAGATSQTIDIQAPARR